MWPYLTIAVRCTLSPTFKMPRWIFSPIVCCTVWVGPCNFFYLISTNFQVIFNHTQIYKRLFPSHSLSVSHWNQRSIDRSYWHSILYRSRCTFLTVVLDFLFRCCFHYCGGLHAEPSATLSVHYICVRCASFYSFATKLAASFSMPCKCIVNERH